MLHVKDADWSAQDENNDDTQDIASVFIAMANNGKDTTSQSNFRFNNVF